MNSKQLKTMLRLMFVIPALAIFAVTGCKGPEGPAGADGTNGTDGTDGVDGNVTCLQCHTKNHMDSIQAQYVLSDNAGYGHGAGGTLDHAGSNSGCAQCHAGNGFVFFQTYGTAPTVQGTLIGCKDCHSGHQTFDPQDYALRVNDGAWSVIDTTWMTLGTDNNGNLCINCHQPRRDWASYGTGIADPDSAYNINSSHAGPHHGPQAGVLLGTAGTIAGTSMYHKTAGCTACHMGEFDATEAIGGHTWKPNPANCQNCHSLDAGTEFDHNGKVADFDTKLTQLYNKLVTAGVFDGTGTLQTGYYNAATYKAWWDYDLLLEDKSHGVHNPTYALTLLSTDIAALP